MTETPFFPSDLMEITGIRSVDTLRKHIKSGKVPPPDVTITRKTRYWLRSTLERAGLIERKEG